MKASKLISQKSMIVDAHGCDSVKVVASYTSPQPHFVRLFQCGKDVKTMLYVHMLLLLLTMKLS